MPILFDHWPTLRIAHVPLCELPTPVERLDLATGHPDGPALYVKRDDLTATAYGGNKVRKLEFLLAEAKRRNAKRILTFGYAGSNCVIATALFAKQHGLECSAILLKQKPAPYVRRNLSYAQALGVRLNHYAGMPTAAIGAVRQVLAGFWHERKKPFWMAAGGSDPLGVLGYVNAAYELAAQVEAGDMPRPDQVYCALGSMGTAVGLSIGFAALGWPTTVVAPRVVGTTFANQKKLEQLTKQTCKLLRSQARDFPVRDASQCNVEIRDGYYGREYGDVTPETQQALDATQGILHLDGTYSAKAFAAVLADCKTSHSGPQQTILFWNTHNSRPIPTSDAPLPKAFRCYE